MKRILAIFVTIWALFLFSTAPLHADSSYVLPYPSTMPGGVNYQLHIAWERVMQYWYFGNFGQFEYNLKEADKYLVEAKTLFEYQQYLLGYTALQKSNRYFSKTLPFLQKAQREGKNIREKRQILHEAVLKHSEVLDKMKEETPADFSWTPEKNPASLLHIHTLIESAMTERFHYL